MNIEKIRKVLCFALNNAATAFTYWEEKKMPETAAVAKASYKETEEALAELDKVQQPGKVLTDDGIAQAFHEAYERLAPLHHYQTSALSAKPWSDVPSNNKALMVATVRDLRDNGYLSPTSSAGLTVEDVAEVVKGWMSGNILAFTDERGMSRWLSSGPTDNSIMGLDLRARLTAAMEAKSRKP